MNGGREGGRKGGREEEMEGGMREGGRKGERERGREGEEREDGREEREGWTADLLFCCQLNLYSYVGMVHIYRECFLPWYHVESSKDLIRHVGMAFPRSTLVCRLSNHQLLTYMQMIWDV